MGLAVDTVWSDSARRVLSRLAQEKTRTGRATLTLPIPLASGRTASLRMVTHDILQDVDGIERLARWRQKHAYWFPAQFNVTVEGTRRWTERALLEPIDRLLFWVIDSQDRRVGHVGLFRLSPDGTQCEIDNILRGEDTDDRGIIAEAIETMLHWQATELRIPESYLRVFSDNEPALRLYEKVGYEEVQRVPLKRREGADRVEWIEVIGEPYLKCERYFVTLYRPCDRSRETG